MDSSDSTYSGVFYIIDVFYYLCDTIASADIESIWKLAALSKYHRALLIGRISRKAACTSDQSFYVYTLRYNSRFISQYSLLNAFYTCSYTITDSYVPDILEITARTSVKFYIYTNRRAVVRCDTDDRITVLLFNCSTSQLDELVKILVDLYRPGNPKVTSFEVLLCMSATNNLQNMFHSSMMPMNEFLYSPSVITFMDRVLPLYTITPRRGK
jgi:hypothetical protein